MQHETQTKLRDYRQFTNKLVLTTACTVLLSSAVSSFVQTTAATFAPLFPSWWFSLIEIVIASAGLWWLTKNGKQ
jgi:hypothetical protein